ncbi:MAG TPA: hypothetical protein DCW93_06990 [Saprospirales bacterium]|jgi:hypothetical protein|nr:hypothetical protein [bacterium]HAV29658.1 hypothetical protein [Saprospirales bacterium]
MTTMRILTLLAFIALFPSCTQKKTLIIDNPTRKAIEVSFEEGFKRAIEPKSQARIVITQSTTTVYLNGDKVGDISFDGDKEYLLNPTLTNYYIEEVVYGGSMHSTPSGTKNDILETQLMFDGVPFEGYVRKDNSLLIADVWRYGIDDDLPLVKENQTPSIKRKIYREVDFQRHAKKLYYDALRAAQ